ncbi:DUF4013 domain-containing protein [Halobacterium litoreum]|uniref:DUF4013 domain-containing protein n=1 Tax=Halobacterium litoreum TaxID=2039234 RepID=A0ABD5NCB5_9EURY|nr:DUF4013 domain-containing protein [Halobacterium litoreum]UHH14196.1 DUF4013 domain-containing protein [Halobacterium litoreum]
MRDALWYPLAGDAETRYLAGWILHLLHALVLPVVPLVWMVGVLGGVARSAARGDDPPALDAEGVSRDALRVSLVLAAYAVPVAGVLALGALVLPSGTDVPAAPVALLAAGLLGLLLPIVYVAPASVVHASVSESLRAGFDRERIGRTLGDARYFTRWAAGLGGLAAAAVAAGALGDYLVGYLLAVYCEVFAFACFGWGASATVERAR